MVIEICYKKLIGSVLLCLGWKSTIAQEQEKKKMLLCMIKLSRVKIEKSVYYFEVLVH